MYKLIDSLTGEVECVYKALSKMRIISKAEWREAQGHGYASIGEDGRRYVLARDPATQATVLEPVEVAEWKKPRK